MVSLEELEKRVQMLEDLEAIRKLKTLYAKACDDGYNPELMMEVFSENAIWDGGQEFGVYRGKKEIYDFFKRVPESFVFAIHYFVMPDITIEGNNAHCRWYLWQAATLKGNRAIWMAGYEDDKYVKIDGRWYQSEMKLTTLFETPYEKGWHKKRMID